VKDKDSGLYKIQTVLKDGPTLLCTCTVNHLKGDQLDSRLHAVEVPFDAAQQLAALEAQARLEDEGTIPEPDPRLLAFQAYLQSLAPIEVYVPFARALFRRLKETRGDSRILRDASRILSLVKGVALLNVTKREKDKKGRIVATLEDYGTVADLLEDSYDAAVTGCPDAVRRVVGAVGKPFTVTEKATGKDLSIPAARSVSDLARALGISQQAASKHVKRALERGWLVNDEQMRGKPARLSPGDPLPSKCGLPTVAQLTSARLPI
jgi:MarR family protein